MEQKGKRTHGHEQQCDVCEEQGVIRRIIGKEHNKNKLKALTGVA